MPGDVSATQTQKGREFFRERNYEEARKAYEKALAHDSRYEPARIALKEMKTIMEADAVIARAAKAAEEARFDDALTIAETAIRIAPTYRATAKMRERIKAMSEAEIAFDAGNWLDSVHLYKSIAADYPSSQLVADRLAVATSELGAEQALSSARDNMQREQLDMARRSLAGISTQSVYYVAVRQMLDAVTWLEEVKRVLLTEDVPKLKQTFDLLASEHDPLKAIDIPTDDLKGKITLRLQALSRKMAIAGKEKVRQAQRMEGFRLYERALEADPTNAEAREASASIRRMIRTECAGYQQDAVKSESLGQTARTVELLQKIMATGIPGEDYYELAKSKLARLKPR